MEENFSMEWNMEENFSMEWNMKWKIFGMEWKWNGKKIASMEYGKIVFHSISYHALPVGDDALSALIRKSRSAIAKLSCTSTELKSLLRKLRFRK